jgi:capsular exopolysaccharide synthesis family protein
LAALWSYTRPTLYTAEAGILVKPAIASVDSSSVDVNPETESQVMHSTKVAMKAAAALDANGVKHPSVAAMLANLEVDVPENTEILQVLYSASTPLMAKQGAQAFADAYLAYRSEEATTKLSEDLASLELQIASIEEQIRNEGDEDRRRDLDAQRAVLESRVFQLREIRIDPGEVIAPPLVPRSPSSPNHVLDLALGAILGLGLGFGLAYLRDRGDSGFQSAAALERSLGGIPVLAVIPSFRDEPTPSRDPISLYRSNGPISESYRTLRTAILGRASRSRLTSLAITSARSGEGKSTTAAMLGIALASAGKRVVLICGDLRRPMALRSLGVTDRPGLAEVLAGRLDSVNDVVQPTSIPNLFVVPSGFAGAEADPAELLQSDRMLKVLEECGGADFVLIDSPAVLAVADALVLAPLADGVLFVASARGTGQQMIEFAKVQIERMGSNIVGGALVGLRRPAGLDPSYYHRPESYPAVRRSGGDDVRPRERQGVDPAAIRQVPPSHRRPEPAAEAPTGPEGSAGRSQPFEPEPRPRPRGVRIEGGQRSATPTPTPGGEGDGGQPLPEPPRRRRANAPSDLPSPPGGAAIFDRGNREEPPSAAAFGAYPAIAEPDPEAPPTSSRKSAPGPVRRVEYDPAEERDADTPPAQRRVAPPRRRRAPQAAPKEATPPEEAAGPTTQPARKRKPRVPAAERAPEVARSSEPATPEPVSVERSAEPAGGAPNGPPGSAVEEPRRAPIALGPSTAPPEQQASAPKPRKRKKKRTTGGGKAAPSEARTPAPGPDADGAAASAESPPPGDADASVVVVEDEVDVETSSDAENVQ